MNDAGQKQTAVTFPLRYKMGFAAALLVAVPLALLGAILLDQSWDVFLDAHKQVHLSMTSEIKSSLENGLSRAQDGIDSAGRVLTDAKLEPDARIALSRTVVSGNASIDHVGIYDARGGFIDAIREEGSRDVLLPETLKEELRNEALDQGMAVGDAITDPDTGTTRVLLVLPYKSGEKTTGFGVAYCSLDFLQNRIQEFSGRVFGAQSYELFIVDHALDVLVHTQREKLKTNLSSSGLFAQFDLGTLQNKHEFMRRYQQGGEDFYGTLVTYPRLKMALGVSVPMATVLSPVYKMSRSVVILLLITMVIGIVLAFFLAKTLTGPLRNLSLFAERLSRREFGEGVDVKTRDELGMVGAAMNQAAQDLQQSEVRIKKETAIRTDLGRYLPEEIVERVVKREQDMALGGERREITVLFADVVAFTPMTEELPPETVVAVLNELFTILTEIVFKHDGMIDKFIGDSIMAIWGAPNPCDDHADRALNAAEDMLSWLEIGNEKWKKKYGFEIRLAVGVNTGEAIVGNIGSTTRMEYTAIGEAVNMAARLEAVARPHQILVGPRTHELAAPHFPFVNAGMHKLPGHKNPVEVFALEGE